jgi:hypothetical protein
VNRYLRPALQQRKRAQKTLHQKGEVYRIRALKESTKKFSGRRIVDYIRSKQD